jgi:hypothetical protein
MSKAFSPVCLAVCLLGVFCGAASAEIQGAGWEVTAHTFPTYLPPGGKGAVEIRVLNVGAANSNGTVTVTDKLPPGVIATGAGAYIGPLYELIQTQAFSVEAWDCSGDGPGGAVAGSSIVTCTNNQARAPQITGGGGEPTRGPEGLIYAGDPELFVTVMVPPGTPQGTKEGAEANRVSVSGGGAIDSASTIEPVTISTSLPPFGFAGADAWYSNADGTLDTQAGSHPYEATFSFDLNTEIRGSSLRASHEPRNLTFRLPPGLVGNPTVVPQCPLPLFVTITNCPPNTQVGIMQPTILGGALNIKPEPVAVYNLVPPPGQPAEFGFNIDGNLTYLGTTVRSGSDYGLTSTVDNITQSEVISSVLTLWGEPSAASHDPWRCANGLTREEYHCGGVSVVPTHRPFLTLPTSCTGPQEFALSLNSWEVPDEYAHTSFFSHNSNNEPEGMTGCENLAFSPSITTSPDTANADTPAGLTVEVKPSVGGLENTEGLSTADLKNTTVTLPEGMVINPGQAAGLTACQPSQDGLERLPDGEENNGPPSCPDSSKVGEGEIETPLLKHNLKGDVYVLQSNPPELKLLVAASGEGVNLKLVGEVHLNEQTGQLTTTFKNTPGVPFSDFKLSFSGGAQAALATPTRCGIYGPEQGFSADFTPWASPFIGDITPAAYFQIAHGTNGAPCPSSPLPFTPTLTAGSTTDQAGGFTNFSLLLQAPDDQQRIERLQFKVPQGLLGMISQVPLCGEPQAQNGTCSSASQIGHTTVASGPGPYPLVVPQPGQPPAAIYLTGPYKGAPYGLSIVVPVVVGPFTLQTQIVRAKIEVDPLTAQITVTTDPLPQVIDGVPADLRTVNAVIDKPGFMFNPTNCSPMSFSGTAWGTPPPGVSGPGSTAPISSPFQMGSCRSLLFKPNFQVSTSGKTSRKNGASLDAKIVYPTEPLGANQASSQSNIKSVKVDLPKQLPSRLTTLQKACTSQVFEANPANCPADSRVGTASAVTPVLPVTLTGPAYFVSYGGAKFPELVVALQGYGVTIYIHGETFINKEGITSSTFHQVPDVPIYRFELKLPQGPYSALAANGNLCKAKLKMPTAFTAQDGAVIKQSTPISVTGCGKAKTKKKAAKHKHKSKK